MKIKGLVSGLLVVSLAVLVAATGTAAHLDPQVLNTEIGSAPPVVPETASLLAEAPSVSRGTTSPLGEAFTFQGRLSDAGGPIVGTCDARFGLYDAAEGGAQLGVQTVTNVTLSDGLFTARLDFGPGVFEGQARWLEIEVRCPAGEGSYAALSPRQPLTPAPYALYAASAGSVPWARITQMPPGFADGVDDTGGPAWMLSGNTGTTPGTHFLGTADNQALELKVNGARVLRLEPNNASPNLVGGYSGNRVTASAGGATISGGGSSGWVQTVTDSHGTIGGGGFNQAGDGAGTVSDASYATVAGGWHNVASGPWSTVGGGFDNAASQDLASVAGGGSNAADGYAATVGGGLDNQATADYATISGGGRTVMDNPDTANRATAPHATIGGGGANSASATAATVGGGTGNSATTQYATVGGGFGNEASVGWAATVAGGQQNAAAGDGAAVGGGNTNQATAQRATVAGGSNNKATDTYATVGGGGFNQAGNDNGDREDAQHATVSGGLSNEAPAWGSAVGGGISNSAAGVEATVGGGAENDASGREATVGGGRDNTAYGDAATVAGGGRRAWNDTNAGNRATDNYGTVGGGANNVAGKDNANKADAEFATVAGGYQNVADGRQATVGGGANNHAGYRATVSGGLDNEASGAYSAIPGGHGNLASHDYTFAGGHRAWASNPGSFVWADSTDEVYSDGGSNQFRVRANGGVYLTLDSEVEGWWTCYVLGGSSWSCTSDRDLKENMVLANGQQVLERLVEVPVYYWSGIGQTSRHLGPTAQDFSAAFALGEGDTSLATIDLDGVALAAIQGLYQQVQDKEEQIVAQQASIAALEARLAALEAAINGLAQPVPGDGP